MDRAPCPARIVDDAGSAFAIGAVGGSIWFGVKGFRNSPRGWLNRFGGAISSVKTRAPMYGGSFAVWGYTFACCDCSLAHLRKKEDPWNAIGSGFLTGGILAMRSGPRAALKNALVGGLVLMVIEGVTIWISRSLVPYVEAHYTNQNNKTMDDVKRLEPPLPPQRGVGVEQPSFSFDMSKTLEPAAESSSFDLDDDKFASDDFDSNANDPYATKLSRGKGKGDGSNGGGQGWFGGFFGSRGGTS